MAHFSGFYPLLRTGILCLPSLLRNGVPLRTSGVIDSASGPLPTPGGCSQWSMLFVRCLDVLSSPAMMRGLSIIRLPPCPISTSTSRIWRHSRVRFNVRFDVVTNQPAVLVYSNGVAMDLCCMGYALDALSSLRDESALSRPSTTSPPLLRASRTRRHVTWSATQLCALHGVGHCLLTRPSIRSRASDMVEGSLPSPCVGP